jgi:hypothetical protein
MTRIADSDTRAKVDIAIAFDVPEFGILTTLDVHRSDIALPACDSCELAFLP